MVERRMGPIPETKYTGVLAEEIETFNRSKEYLFANFRDRFVLIKGNQIIKVTSSIDEALSQGAMLYGLNGFLVRPIREQEPIYLPNLELGLISL